ncbi:MAG: MFS transporter, partial [Acetobacteraceae bacterium]
MDDGEPPRIAPAAAGGSWERLMWAMVGVQFTMTLSFTILSPILPLFLPDLGVKSADSIDWWAGILNGTTPFVAAFASPIWGKIADVKGRKQALIRASIAIGIFTVGMGISQNVWQFFGARVLMGAFAGFSAASIALVASQVPEGKLGYALGWLSTGQLVGGLVGPLLGGAIAEGLDWRWIFWLNLPIGVVLVPLALRRIPESYGPRSALDLRGIVLVTGAALG